MKRIFFLVCIVFISSSCTTRQAPETVEYPRMPDEYRDKGMDKGSRDAVGMYLYDAAETDAEDDYFGVEVISLEESKKILKERKDAEKSGKEGSKKTE